MKLLALFAVLLLTACNLANPERGDKIGQIAKVIDAEGLVCKTASILVTGKFGGGELRLTVLPNLIRVVKQYNDTQEFVRVTYHANFISSSCSNDTDNKFLDTVEPHPEGAPGK